MVGRTLTANSNIFALFFRRADRHRQQRFHRVVTLVKQFRHHAGIAIQPQRQLRHVVRTNREAIKILEELFSQQGIGRDLAHHDDLQPVLAAFKPLARQLFDDRFRLVDRPHERDHDFDVGKAHIVAHAFHRFAFQRKTIAETFCDVTARAAEAQHRVFFMRLITFAADQVGVFVGLKVRQANDDAFRVEGGA